MLDEVAAAFSALHQNDFLRGGAASAAISPIKKAFHSEIR
jgi:hypothetical protein